MNTNMKCLVLTLLMCGMMSAKIGGPNVKQVKQVKSPVYQHQAVQVKSPVYQHQAVQVKSPVYQHQAVQSGKNDDCYVKSPGFPKPPTNDCSKCPVQPFCPIDPNCQFYEVDENGTHYGCGECKFNSIDYQGVLAVVTSDTDTGNNRAALRCEQIVQGISNCIWQEIDQSNTKRCRLCNLGFVLSADGESCSAVQTGQTGIISDCFSYIQGSGTIFCVKCNNNFILDITNAGSICTQDTNNTICNSIIPNCDDCLRDLRTGTAPEFVNICMRCNAGTIAQFIQATVTNEVSNTYSACYRNCAAWADAVLFLP